MALKTYRELEVWQKAMDLPVPVYRLSGELPATQTYHGATASRNPKPKTRNSEPGP